MANLGSTYNDSAMRGAVAQVVESGQQLLVDRLDLAQLELKLGMQTAAERATVFLAAGGVVAVGFVVFTYGLVAALALVMPMSAAALIVGAFYLTAGIVTWWQVLTPKKGSGGSAA